MKYRRRVQKNLDIIEVFIEKIVPGGKGMGYLDQKVVFVSDALAGEKHRVQLIKDKKDFCEGYSIEVLVASKDRVKPRCLAYGNCGGCDFQFTHYENQLVLKKQMIKDSFSRLAKLTLGKEFKVAPSPKSWGYRTRARLSQLASKNILGFKERKGSKIVNLDTCPVLSNEVSRVLKARRNLNPDDVEVSIQSNGKQIVAKSKTPIEIVVQGKTLKATTDVFFQSNLEILPIFLDWILARTPNGGLALDLFSGVGFFAVFLEEKFDKVIAVERNKGCLELAKENVTDKTEFYTGDVTEWSQLKQSHNVDFLIVDPPREGLDAKVLAQIQSWKPESWIYVSCNPVTLARDTKRVMDAGIYQVKASQAFDFYPQTSHCEMVIQFILIN